MLRLVALGSGFASIVVALGLMVVPIRADGVSGNAIAPRYTAFGWFAYEPLPEHPTSDDLRAAGVRVPQDAVAERRRESAIIAAAGLALLLSGLQGSTSTLAAMIRRVRMRSIVGAMAR